MCARTHTHTHSLNKKLRWEKYIHFNASWTFINKLMTKMKSCNYCFDINTHPPSPKVHNPTCFLDQEHWEHHSTIHIWARSHLRHLMSMMVRHWFQLTICNNIKYRNCSFCFWTFPIWLTNCIYNLGKHWQNIF